MNSRARQGRQQGASVPRQPAGGQLNGGSHGAAGAPVADLPEQAAKEGNGVGPRLETGRASLQGSRLAVDQLPGWDNTDSD